MNASMAVELVRYRFTADEYEQMIESGILAEDDRLELVEGEIIAMSPIGSEHAACVKRLNYLLQQALGARVIVGVQDPIRLDAHSQPQPDLTVLAFRPDFYNDQHPAAADVLLAVEVADSSAVQDRAVKLPLYAAAGIREVWLVDLPRQCVECHRAPAVAGYRLILTAFVGEHITIESFPNYEFAVGDIFGCDSKQ